MSSGKKAVFINSRERAVSTDVNRLQAFAAAADAELARWMFNVLLQADDFGNDQIGGYDQQNTTLTSPVSGEIVGGLLVRPQLAASANPLSFTIDAGVGYFVNPDGDPDGSVYKYVDDPGLAVGVLNFAPGGGGGTRVDLVAAKWTLNGVAETDNRDIFNPSTGLFTATTVTKATQGFLTYQIFSGAAAGGMASALAALPAGWMPLMVAVVPAAAVSNDGMTFYDVRPMLANRNRQPFNVGVATPAITNKWLAIDNNGAANAFLFGRVEAEGVLDTGTGKTSPYRVGGAITLAGSPDLSTAQFQSGGAPANGLAYVYLAQPFGLPNWRQYTTAGFGSRVPIGFRGVVMISNTGPIGPLEGGPSAALALPVSTGLGGSTQAAICIACAIVSGGAVLPLSNDGKFDYATDIANGYSTGNGALVGSTFTFTLNPNGARNALGYAACAKALRIEILMEFTVATVSNGQIDLRVSGTNAGGSETFFVFPVCNETWDNRSGGNLTWNKTIVVDVPVPPGTGGAWKLVVATNAASGATASLATATIIAQALL